MSIDEPLTIMVKYRDCRVRHGPRQLTCRREEKSFGPIFYLRVNRHSDPYTYVLCRPRHRAAYSSVVMPCTSADTRDSISQVIVCCGYNGLFAFTILPLFKIPNDPSTTCSLDKSRLFPSNPKFRDEGDSLVFQSAPVSR